MKCRACNVSLSDYESSRKDEHGVHVDMCNKCFKLKQVALHGDDGDYYAVEHDRIDADLMNQLGIGDY